MILVIGIALALFVVPDGWQWPVVVGAGFLEVAETTITWKWSRRGAPKVGVETMIGAVGRAVTECRQNGTVRVRGEIWQARCEAGVDKDQRIRVRGRENLTLIVDPID